MATLYFECKTCKDTKIVKMSDGLYVKRCPDCTNKEVVVTVTELDGEHFARHCDIQGLGEGEE
jgi:Zn-finger protein